MTSDDFSELLMLITKLRVTAEKAANTNPIFKKYHQASIPLLTELPEHIFALKHALFIANLTTLETNQQMQKERVEEEQLELVS